MLTNEEKILLREAIFDSEFEADYGMLSQQLLATIDALDDEVVRARLVIYSARKEAEKLAKIQALEDELNNLKGVYND